MSESNQGDRLDLVVVGNLVVDDLVQADGTTRMRQAGGAVIYVALAARLCGLKVGIVSRVGSDYPRSMLDQLAARGIDLAGIQPMEGAGLRLWLLDEGAKRQVVHRLEGPSHGQATPKPADLPDVWRDARAVHLAPMPFEDQLAWVAAMAGRKMASRPHLSLDPFELLRDPLDRWRPLLDPLDVFLVSEDELLLTGDVESSLRPLLRRQTALVLKQGSQGGVVWHQGERSVWSAQAQRVVDTTGAGDAFAAGFLTGRLRNEGIAQCAESGDRAAALAIGGIGAEGLLTAEGC